MVARTPILVLMPCTAGEATDDCLFAQGFTDDLQAELARFRTLNLVCWADPGSNETDHANRSLPSGSVGVYILRTSLRRSGEIIRITAGLTEENTRCQLWGHRYDVPHRELYAVENDIVAQTAVTLSARLEEAILLGARGKSIDNLEAYELWLRGKAELLAGTLEGDAAARDLFERALQLDPTFAPAHAGLSMSWFNEWTCQIWNLYNENGQKAYEYAHRALALDDTDAWLNLVIGRVLLYRRDFDKAAWYLDRALTLSPNNADCLIQLSLCQSLLGQHQTGIECAEKAFRVHPFHPNWYYAFASFPHLLARQIDTAIDLGRKALEAPILDLPAGLAVCYALKGEMEHARHWYASFEEQFKQQIIDGREPRPGEAVDWFLTINPVRSEEDIAFIRDGFNRIGVASAVSNDTDRVPAITTAQANSKFTRQGASWLLEYAGQTTLLPDMKGLRDIATLIASPGKAIHCFDLSDHVQSADGGDQVLDEKARQAYLARVRDLQEDIAAGEDANDSEGVARAQTEMDTLLATLSNALGLGGRRRRLGSMAERARSTVTWRIRYALRKVEEVHPPLGRHLRNAVSTGTFCVYQPETPLTWELSTGTEQRPVTAISACH